MPISATNYDGTKDYEVAEMSDLAKPNLFDNGDFRYGVINQKGSTTYTSNATDWNRVYGIDRWFIQHGMQLQVFSDYIKLTNKTTIVESGFFIQPVTLKQNTQYTLTVYLSSLSGNIILTADEDRNLTCKVGLNTITFTTGTKQKLLMGLSIATANGTCNISYIKLEEGPQFTGMPVWNKSVELTKCLKKYINYTGTRVTLAQFYLEQYQGLLFPVEMDNIPTVTGTYEGRKVGFECTKRGISIAWAKDSQGVFDNLPQSLIIGDLIIDANDY